MHENKQIERLLDGKLIVIKDKNHTETTVPLFCLCCNFPMKTMEDSISYRKCKACHHCESRWSGQKNISLVDGIYPDKTSFDWKEFLEIRALSSKTIFNLK